uniref:Uncharacterized protein n=1 Tax=Ralstonia solanacearum TaxID=305 RepID=A0A0S4W8Y8_RALSL|nr:protein of unknown function [Ralstonia solanacearum]
MLAAPGSRSRDWFGIERGPRPFRQRWAATAFSVVDIWRPAPDMLSHSERAGVDNARPCWHHTRAWLRMRPSGCATKRAGAATLALFYCDFVFLFVTGSSLRCDGISWQTRHFYAILLANVWVTASAKRARWYLRAHNLRKSPTILRQCNLLPAHSPPPRPTKNPQLRRASHRTSRSLQFLAYLFGRAHLLRTEAHTQYLYICRRNTVCLRVQKTRKSFERRTSALDEPGRSRHTSSTCAQGLELFSTSFRPGQRGSG